MPENRYLPVEIHNAPARVCIVGSTLKLGNLR